MNRPSAKDKAEWKKAGLQITGEEWTRRVLLLPKGPIQNQVASIIYWDFCLDNPNAKNRAVLDDLALEWRRCEVIPAFSLVVQALVKVGYPKVMAEMRMVPVCRQTDARNGIFHGTLHSRAQQSKVA